MRGHVKATANSGHRTSSWVHWRNRKQYLPLTATGAKDEPGHQLEATSKPKDNVPFDTIHGPITARSLPFLTRFQPENSKWGSQIKCALLSMLCKKSGSSVYVDGTEIGIGASRTWSSGKELCWLPRWRVWSTDWTLQVTLPSPVLEAQVCSQQAPEHLGQHCSAKPWHSRGPQAAQEPCTRHQFARAI